MNDMKQIAIYTRSATKNRDTWMEENKEHYNDIISQHPTWKLTDIYYDTGSNSNTSRKPDFNRMVSDCQSGYIDLILTKSIATFSRNIIDVIMTVRKLSSLTPPVGVYFESEEIFTLNDTSSLNFLSEIKNSPAIL